MAELWSVIESNPIKVINPTQSWGGKKLDPRLYPLNVKSHQKKFHLKRLRNGIVMVRLRFCKAAWKTAVLQGLYFV